MCKFVKDLIRMTLDLLILVSPNVVLTAGIRMAHFDAKKRSCRITNQSTAIMYHLI